MDDNPYKPPQTEPKRPLGKRYRLSMDELEFRRGAFVLLALGALFLLLYAVQWW